MVKVAMVVLPWNEHTLGFLSVLQKNEAVSTPYFCLNSVCFFVFLPQVTEMLLCADTLPEKVVRKAVEVVATQCYTKVQTLY